MGAKALKPELRERVLEELPEVLPRVLARAVVFARDYRVRAHLSGHSGEAAEDLVQEAISRLFSGDRGWDPERVPDLEYFLVRTVSSIADAYKKKGARRAGSFDDVNPPDPISNGRESVASMDERMGERQAVEQLETDLIACAGDDDDLLSLVEVLLDGCETPREVAARLGWTSEKAHVQFRKLRRRLRKVAPSGLEKQ